MLLLGELGESLPPIIMPMIKGVVVSGVDTGEALEFLKFPTLCLGVGESVLRSFCFFLNGHMVFGFWSFLILVSERVNGNPSFVMQIEHTQPFPFFEFRVGYGMFGYEFNLVVVLDVV